MVELPRRAEAVVADLPQRAEAAMAELLQRAEAVTEELPLCAVGAAAKLPWRGEAVFALRRLEACLQEPLKRRPTAD
jgi:hypothetical protein